MFFYRKKDKTTPLIAGITKSNPNKQTFPLLALDILGEEIQCFTSRAEEAQGLGMHCIMAATWGDNTEQERFDLKLTWIAPVAEDFSQPTDLE